MGISTLVQFDQNIGAPVSPFQGNAGILHFLFSDGGLR